MKTFNVSYTRTVIEETNVSAKNLAEAKKKFKEVLPTDIIDSIWEIKSDKDRDVQ
jgi:hypothetical protein